MDLAKYQVVRLAIIRSVNYANQTCQIQMLDRADTKTYTCPLPNPYVAGSTGIYSYPVAGKTHVIVDYGYNDQPYIVSTLALGAFAKDFSQTANTFNMSADETGIPFLVEGEIAIKGFKFAQIKFARAGTIEINHGNSFSKYSPDEFEVYRTDNLYRDYASHRETIGEIRRDIRKKTSTTEDKMDHMTDLSYEKSLTTIARNPLRNSVNLTTRNSRRNPSLVEHKTLHYEFSKRYNVGSLDSENLAYAESYDVKNNFFNRMIYRDNARTDILDLNPIIHNHLSETVHGTLVDYYGNILDINRNPVQFDVVASYPIARHVPIESALLRRSIKFHFEINSRKDGDATNTVSSEQASSLEWPDVPHGYLHSHWSIDVDGEGLTKINIPANSNRGNVPFLVRHRNKDVIKDSNQEGQLFSFRDDKNIDFAYDSFGLPTDGISMPDPYATLGGQNFVYKTAFHDITTTALSTFASGSHPMVEEISNSIFSAAANAGGRSVHANMDGSLELNVGRDTIDHKSIVIDTSGGIVSRIGKDRNDNSIVSQLDGHVKVLVGDSNIAPDDPVEQPSVKFYVKGSTGMATIEIIDGAIYLTSAPNKNLIIRSSNNLILDAKNDVFIGGENVHVYGSYTEQDTDGTIVPHTDVYGDNIMAHRIISRQGNVI